MKRIHYLLLGLLVSLTIAAVSPSLPPTRIAPGSGITVTTNGVNNFTLSAGSSVTNLSNGADTVLLTNAIVYSSGTTNWPFRAMGTNGLPSYIDKDGNFVVSQYGSGAGPYYGLKWAGSSASIGHRDASSIYISPVSGPGSFVFNSTGFQIGDDLAFYFQVPGMGGASSPYLYGKQSTIEQRSGAVAQTNRLYGTYTDSGNYVRLALSASTTSVSIAAESAGTGSADLDLILTPKGTGGVVIGGGARIVKVLSATATLDFDLTAVVVEDKTITVTGAVSGDTVSVGAPNGSVTATVQFTGWVSAADTVTIRARTSAVGENPASGTFRATVTRF